MSATPFSLRHRPGPVRLDKPLKSRMELPVAITSIERISPSISKYTIAFYEARGAAQRTEDERQLLVTVRSIQWLGGRVDASLGEEPIVLIVIADPEPDDVLALLGGESTVLQTNARGP